MGRVGSGVACASCVAALRLYRDMLLCAIPPSGCVAGGGAGVAIAAVFAFLTDLYLEYFAGACTAGAGVLSVIVVMAGFSGYFFRFRSSFAQDRPSRAVHCRPLYVWYFSTYYNYRGFPRDVVCLWEGGGGGQNVSKVGESGESTTGKFKVVMSWLAHQKLNEAA